MCRTGPIDLATQDLAILLGLPPRTRVLLPQRRERLAVLLALGRVLLADAVEIGSEHAKLDFERSPRLAAAWDCC